MEQRNGPNEPGASPVIQVHPVPHDEFAEAERVAQSPSSMAGRPQPMPARGRPSNPETARAM